MITFDLTKEQTHIRVDWEAGQYKRSAIQQKMIDLEAETPAAQLHRQRPDLIDYKKGGGGPTGPHRPL
ncbi:MAG: hypothetical protein KFF50_10910 [Desulfatitalea sp.]|nr:hypothetical protein [Desulfatitalea sp.]